MKKILPIIIVALIVGGGAFYGGMKYGQSSSPASQRQNGGFANFAPGQAGTNGSGSSTRGGFTNGEIIAKDDTSITVKLQDGSTKIIFYSASTNIGEIASGTNADLGVGKTVMATGTTNSDGSITATSIQLRPAAPANAPTNQ